MRALRPYALIVLAWTLVGLIYLGQDVTRRIYIADPRPWQEIGYWAVRVYLSAALTPLILLLGRRWPFERQQWRRRVALHLAFSVIFAVVGILLETAILWLIGVARLTLPVTLRRWYPLLLIWGFHSSIIAYWVILGVQSGLRYYQKFHEREEDTLRLELRASELKSQLVHARLSALKMQLQPHFLFNTLNAIVVLVRQQRGREAEDTLARFSDLLRAVLGDIEAEEVPLHRELEYLRLYLSIEQVRFSDRLQIAVSADPTILDALVPHMGLQPIVENAVRHGISRRAAAGSITITALKTPSSLSEVSRSPAGALAKADGTVATADGDTLRITVTDDGPGLPSGVVPEGKGIGLANTRARLEQLYGEAARLQIASRDGGGTVVTMSLPYRE
jgi:two-component system LytT family sensor kinase